MTEIFSQQNPYENGRKGDPQAVDDKTRHVIGTF